jgi:ATP-binding cassette subfamily F protein 3
MYSIDSLCEAIKNFEGSTILVTHSEMMLRELADALIIFHHDKAEFFEGNYDEFLEKIGWEEEGDTAPKKVVTNDYAQSKKLRSKLIQERSSKLSPLKKQIEQCEAKIMKLEEAIKAKNEALIACSSGNDIGELGRLSKDIKSDEETLEKLYEQFETLHVNHDTLFDTYEIQLKNI